MSGSTENLIQGAGWLYFAPLDTAEPADADVADAPTSPWVSLGFTNDGVGLAIEQAFSELSVDQLVDVPGRRLTRRDLKITTNLAEATLENLRIALNDLSSTVTTAATHKSFEPTTAMPGVPNYAMLLFDGIAPSGLVRRVIVRKALQISNVGSEYKKDGQTLLPVEFGAHYVSSSVAPYKVVDELAA